MEQFKGRLLSGDRVLIPEVCGALERHTAADGSESWTGTFDLPGGRPILRGPYRLVLGEGDWQLVFVGGYESDGERSVAHFGPPPHGEP